MKNYIMISACLLAGALATSADAAKENPGACVSVTLSNAGAFNAVAEYTQCGGGTGISKVAWNGTPQKFSVIKGDEISVYAQGATKYTGKYKADVDTDIECEGATLWQAKCTATEMHGKAKSNINLKEAGK